MRSLIADTDLLRDLYVVIESLRNSADLIDCYIAQWVMLRLAFAPPRGQDWVDCRRALLLALGVEVETCEILASTLELVLEDG